MLEKKNQKLKKKIEKLETMLEEKTRNLFVEKERVETYSNFIRTVVDSINDMVIAIDKEGKVELVNNSAREMLHIEDDKDVNIRKILGDRLVNKLIKEEKNNINQVESVLINSNQSKIPVLASRVPFIQSENDKPGYVYSIVDMTKLKEKENTIEKQRAQLVQGTQLASLGEIASGIAHEINNPVTVMDGQIRRLEDYLSDNEITLEERVELIKKIKSNLNRVVNIVSGIRKISRKGEGDAVTSLKLSKVIESLKGLCKEKFRNNQVKINFSVHKDELLVLAKETQLLQVLMNLVMNSSDAIEDLEEKWINIEVQESLGKVEIRIVDSGNGIERERAEKIFNPFFTTKDIGKGTGIGLSISKQMMKDQDGSLDYELYKGNTSFLLRLNIP